MPHNTLIKKLSLNFDIMKRLRSDSQHLTALIYKLYRATNDRNFRMLLHELELPSQTLANSDIIGVHSCNVLASCKFAGTIQRFDQSPVFLAINEYPGVAPLVRV